MVYVRNQDWYNDSKNHQNNCQQFIITHQAIPPFPALPVVRGVVPSAFASENWPPIPLWQYPMWIYYQKMSDATIGFRLFYFFTCYPAKTELRYDTRSGGIGLEKDFALYQLIDTHMNGITNSDWEYPCLWYTKITKKASIFPIFSKGNSLYQRHPKTRKSRAHQPPWWTPPSLKPLGFKLSFFTFAR